MRSIKTVISVILGIVGLFAWIVPLVGMVVTLLGAIAGALDYRKEMITYAEIGIMLNVLGFLMSCIFAVTRLII